MKRIIPTAFTALALWGCGNTSNTPVISSREVGAGAEQAAAVQRAAAEVLGQKFEVGGVEELQARAVIEDDTGATHVRFDRTFQGLRVLGGDFVVHSNTDGVTEFSVANTLSLKGVESKAHFDGAAASVLAQAAFTGVKLDSSSAELVVDALEGRAAALAYEVILEGLQADGTPSELHVLVDARTGAIRGQWEGIETAAAVGTGNSLYSGTVSINTNSVSGGYELRDTTRGKGFYTTGTGITTDADNVWGNGTTSNAQSAAVDAHYGIQVTYDYYFNTHGRNGIDGAGGAGYNTVHYGTKYNNAFWSDSCFCMTYGDGDGTTFTPLTALDVAGHEMTHGVTSRTAKLVYSGESGGLNEATSDIFGTLVEYYANNANDPGDYIIGEEIYTPAKAGDGLRYMYNPSLDGKSANCWSSSVGSLDVHYSSGVANHFFYLLAEGSKPASGPASPTCNGATVTGIGRAAAGKIWYRALTVYMTSSTKYAAARTATLNAAKDLYGSGSTQYNAVAAAWTAVSVN
ncbi:M4 family metallopeptidase [Vitiosangium sp. GDMCC 1.1324]|uniref:M4 family metallopeptidase n=1 Tax=Vitiosangium sp. (strain GDMCC 1.1324) TaxID=2138576 RepID=UPI000D36AA43|nr:M4 family metallopeptidase [Vitiosangium sp. GDMCC 1.1324]PTL83631.1 peptidase M4 family protein [Vitiosangium sp. GDMCC 1.1324]